MTARDVFGIVGTTQAGNFHIERVVAEGGFGVVYRALHGGFRAPVAVKCLKIPEQMTKQQRSVFLEKFREEAELMFRLSAAITEVCRPLHVDVLLLSDGRFVPFLALEWLEGESLDGIITRRREGEQPPLGLHKVVKMMRPIAGALAKAHRFPGPSGAVSIIHRDLKPENIFVVKQGGTEVMKILDYGIAKAKRSASQAAGRITGRTLEEDEQASFTPAYGAPEQWSPKTYGETGPWTDIWGLALSMVETLCGAPVIDGDTYVMRRAALDEKRRPTPRNHGAEIPVEVDKVFEKALAVDPRKRYKEVETFFSDLEKSMGLPPTLGPRDSRREPQDSGKIESISAHSMQLAKIELSKMPLEGGFSSPPKKISIEGKPVPASRPDAIAPPPARPPEPSGSWEFDLGPASEPRSSAKPRAPMPSMELEMHLPTESDRPPASAPYMRRSFTDLEAMLPTSDAGAGADLEAALPTQAALAPQPVPLSPPDPSSGIRPSADPISGIIPSARTSSPALASEELSLDLATPAPRAEVQLAINPMVSLGSPPLPPPAAGFEPSSVRRPEGTMAQTRPRQEPRTTGERLKAPVSILLVALAVALVDFGYHKANGEQLMLGPVRPFWIAAPLALIGVGFTLWRLMEGHDDE